MKKTAKYLNHIQDSIGLIFDAVEKAPNIFFDDIHIQNAVYRYFEIIGEATKCLPNDFKQDNPHINWRQIAGLRDVIIHQYDGVDPKEIWLIIERDLPQLQMQIKSLLN
jgi:uncharacterized protein with HEPN domain